jgi:hypothetical protein
VTKKKPSKKPAPPLVGVILSHKKPARHLVERLSDVQKEVEVVIIKKFLSTIRDKEQRNITSLNQTPEHEQWPDFKAKEGDVNWAIELTELVIPGHAKQWAKNRDHASRSVAIRVDEAQHLLECTILNKIEKCYAPLSNNKILLLIYDLRMGGFATSISDSIGLGNAHKVLQNNKHYFDEVWYMYPFPEKAQGIVLQIWPM